MYLYQRYDVISLVSHLWVIHLGSCCNCPELASGDFGRHFSILHSWSDRFEKLSKNGKFFEFISNIISNHFQSVPLCTGMSHSPTHHDSMSHLWLFDIQLLSQKFVPHRKSGFCPLPLTDDPNYLATLVGIKLATGFQILFSEKSKNETENENSSRNLEKDENFEKYLKKLKSNNYFQGELEKSKKWKILEQNAKSFYDSFNDSSVELNLSHRKVTSTGLYFDYPVVKL